MRSSLSHWAGLAAATWVLAATAHATPDSGAPAGAGSPAVARSAMEFAIRRVYPALVRIHVVSAYYGDGREVKEESSGSGVIISREGYVVTNHHVAGKAKRIRCTLSSKVELEATLVGTDALSDIAVLKLDLAGRGAPAPLPVATWGDSVELQVGDPVLAMGSPLALSQSVTEGIVSNVEMTFPSLLWPATFRLDGEETGSLVKWIGHDAQIFPGNSGGPLVNLAGEIVGINEISFGLGGAIPSSLAREVAEELIRRGAVRRSWLGLAVQPLLKGSGDRGALVSGVLPGSPASEAGLAPGDVLISYGGTPVTVRYAEELPAFHRRVLGTPVGARVELIYRRGEREQRAWLTTAERGAALGPEAEVRSWGLALRELTLLSAKELRRGPGSGLVVTSLRAGAAAAEAKPPLQARDIITRVAGHPVRSVQDLLEVTERATTGKSGPVPVLVGFERRSQQLLTVLKIGARAGPDRSVEARKAWVPVATQVLTPDLAEALGLRGRTGVRLTQVLPGGTAEAAGLRVGDVLLRVDGDPIAASRAEDGELFSAMIRQYALGSRVKLEGYREGAPLAVEVTLATSPVATREVSEYRDAQFEFAVRELTLQDRLQGARDRETTGALVTSVESGGWAAVAHLAVGDVVLSVDGNPIASSADLEARMKQVTASRPARVVFFVARGVQTLFLELEPAWTAATSKVAQIPGSPPEAP